MKSTLAGLYGITDSQLMADDKTLLSRVEAAIAGGLKVLQYRDKSTDHSKRLRQAKALNQLCQAAEIPLLINDDVALALAVDAAGVHLGRSDGSLQRARQQLGEKAIIGATCHGSLTFAEEADAAGVNYLAFGACFPSPTKPNAATISLDVLREARSRFTRPLVAIGGISVDNAAQPLAAGAAMIAVVHQLFAADDVQARALAFRHIIEQHS